MTGKQQAFADILIKNPTMPAVQAAKMVYNATTDNSASVQAYDNLRNPKIMAYMQIHADKASKKIITLVDSEKEEIALRASQDILDRTYGKAKQSMEVQSTSVNILIDLTNSEE